MCRKEVEAAVMVMVRTFPITVDDAEVVMVDFRGMGVRFSAVPEARLMFGTIPAEVQEAVIAPAAMLFSPFALCAAVVVPDAMVTVPPAEQEYWLEEAYVRLTTVVPSMVTLAPTRTLEK